MFQHNKSKLDNNVKSNIFIDFSKQNFLKLIKLSKPKYNYLFFGIIMLIVTSSIQVFIPTIVAKLINDFTTGINFKLVSLIFALFICSAFFSITGSIILGVFGEDIIKKLRRILLKKILSYKILYFDDIKSGELTSHISNDTTQLKQVLSENIPQSIASIITICGTLFMMIRTDWHMTLVIIVSIPALFILLVPIMTIGTKIGNTRQESLAKFNGLVNEMISEIRLIKMSNAEKHVFEKLNIKIKELYYIGKKEALFDAIIQPLLMMVFMCTIFGILTYGLHLISTGEIRIGVLFSFLMYLFNLIGSLPTLSSFASEIAKVNGATNRIYELILKEGENFNIGSNFNLQAKVLNVKYLSFSYSNNIEALTLENISLIAKPNQITALVGPSGGGKSTIFGILERFYEPTNGSIYFGNQNISNINLKNYRRQIGFVSQEAGVISGTIRENLIFGLERIITEKELWSVLKLSYADQFVERLPLQLDTEIGEQGIKLSGGERQRLAIARAFLRNPKLLILDEVTANLDSESEAKVQESLTNLMSGRTTLIIAHRLSTIINSDCIYFIENGQITGYGKHEYLVDTHPLYASYIKEQFSLPIKK